MNERSLRRLVLGVLVLVALGNLIDLVLDRPADWRTLHVIVELLLMLISASVAAYLLNQWRQTSSRLENARRSLEEQRAEHDAWRARAESALVGMGRAIDEQFARWKLSPAEREVAFLLLKGFGHKQVAAATGRSERTVRQHAVGIYEKSGLGGRAELAAFFLEGLMIPPAGHP